MMPGCVYAHSDNCARNNDRSSFYENLCNQAICKAVLSGHLEVIGLLLIDERVDPTAVNNMRLRVACASGHLNVMRLLIDDSRVDASLSDSLYRELVCKAATSGYADVVRFLLQDDRLDHFSLDTSRNFAYSTACSIDHVEIAHMIFYNEST